MSLKTFLSVLIVYRSNFQVLHWLAAGKSFEVIHKKTEEYYNEISDDVDVIAEMVLRNSDEIVNYKEALEIIEEDDNNFILVDSKRSCEMEDFIELSTKMLKDILSCIESVLEDVDNIGIKSSLESLYEKYDLQANYILRRFKK